MSQQSIRDRLNKAGYLAPYLDEPRIVKTLESQGVNLAKYRAKKAVASYKANGANDDKANGHDESKTALVVTVAPSKETTPVTTETLPVVAMPDDPKSEKIAKLRAAWDRKLIPRLARLLPEGNTDKGKQHAKKILKAGNYLGPRWDDEARAIGIFRDAGIDISQFEWENQTHAVRLNEAGEIAAWKLGQAELARTALEQFESEFFDAVFRGELPRRVPHPLTRAFDALNDLRARRPKRNRD